MYIGKISRKVFFFIFLFLVMSICTTTAYSPTHYKPIYINNTGGSEQTYYQVPLNITYDSDMNIDFSDIRVKNKTSGEFVPYWIEDKVDGSWCKIWFNASSIPANSWCNDTYYLLYGNSSASSASDGEATFEFFDAFNKKGRGFQEIWNSGTLATGTDKDTARNILIDGNYLYAVSSSGKKFVVYDITDPTSPIQKSSVNTTYNNIDIRGKKGNYVFVSNADGVDVWNVSDVENPILDNHVSFGTYVHGMYLDGDYLYCCMHQADKFQIIDVSDPTNPVVKGSLSGSTYFNGCHDVAVDGNYAYVANYLSEAGEYGFVVVDVSDKNNLSVVAYAGEGHKNSDIIKLGNYVYVGSHQPDSGLIVYDVSNPSSPVYKGRFLTSEGLSTGYWLAIYNSTHFAMISQGSDKLYLVDVSTPDSPIIVASKIMAHNPKNVAITGNYFFVSIEDQDTYNWSIYGYELQEDVDICTLEKWTVHTGTFTSSSTIYHSSPCSLKVPSGNNVVKSNFTFSDQEACVHFWMAVAGTNNKAYCTIKDPDDNNPYATNIKFDSGTIYYLCSDGYSSTGKTYSTNEWHEIKIILKPSVSKFDVYVDDMENPIATDKNWYSGTGLSSCRIIPAGDSSHPVDLYVDDFIVRKYTDPEPSAQLGAEQNVGGDCTAPTISSLTNSTPTTNSVTITWTTNQSTDNRVKYSKNSDLSNPLWSSWANDTSSVSITLTGLDPNTVYYYQVWSYNGTNSSCYTTEPEGQPYNSFVTQQETSEGCTSPEISSLTVSDITANSAVISWNTNQSSDNRVKYSKNSDLSNPSWSSWDNDTTSVSITLSGLDSNTTYYYQVWSYNGTNSSCYTIEPSSQPYKNFTTMSMSESESSESHDIITIKEWLSESQVTYELIFILIIVVVSVLVIRAFLFSGTITEEEIIIAVKFIILTIIVLIIGVAIIQNLEGLI